MKSQVYFGDEEIKQAYNSLRNSKSKELYKWISKAIDDLEKNAFYGIQIAKRLIPREWVLKFNIDNLWKYNLPKGWRLFYSVSNNKVVIITIIIDWLSHKEYERRFKY